MCQWISLKQLPESQRRCLAQDVSAKVHALRPSQLEPFVNISTAHILESTEGSAVPAEVVDVKTSVEEPPVAVQATAPFLLSASRVPSCVVATWMSRATTARGQLPLASSEKHHTLSVMSRSSRASAANHLSTFRPRCQGRRCASGVTTPRANRPNSAADSGYFRAQYLDRVIDMPVVTQPQVQMFLKVKSTTG